MTRNLRSFPHVVKRIKLLWGHPELELYIRKLQIPNKQHDGFPVAAFRDLNKIVEVHRLLFGAGKRRLSITPPCNIRVSHS